MKSRKVKSYSGFRGLDLENRENKVAPFRASGGYNFKLESDMLRTRPAMVGYKDLPFILAEDEILVGFYEYNNYLVYITTKDLYLYDYNGAGKDLYKLSTSNKFIVIANGFTFNYDEKYQPLFQEEKDVLFIFGLDGIYVLSICPVYEETLFAFYDLKNKPNSNFLNEEVNEWYRNLPTPYIPTLTIGGNKLDDVNLLSNLSRYKVFTSLVESNDYYKSYFLPTYYDEEKHKSYSADVVFYDGKYYDEDGEIKVFPVFLGVEGENFASADDFGNIHDTDPEIKIKEVFYSKKISEYGKFKNEQDEETLVVINEQIGLTKEEFFNMTIPESSQNETVFERLMQVIKDESKAGGIFTTETPKTNYITRVYLDVEMQVRTIDGEKNTLIEQKAVRKTFAVYVLFKRYDVENVDLVNVIKDSGNNFIEGKFGVPQVSPVYQAGDVSKPFPALPELYTNKEQNDILSVLSGRTFTQNKNKTIFSDNPLGIHNLTSGLIDEIKRESNALIVKEIKKETGVVVSGDNVRVNNLVTLRRDYSISRSKTATNFVAKQNAFSGFWTTNWDTSFKPYDTSVGPGVVELSFEGSDHFSFSGTKRYGIKEDNYAIYVNGKYAYYKGIGVVVDSPEYKYLWQYDNSGYWYATKTRSISGVTPVILVHFRSTGEPQYYGYYSVATVGYVNVGISCYKNIFSSANEFINDVPGLNEKIEQTIQNLALPYGQVKLLFKIKYVISNPVSEISEYYYTFEVDYDYQKEIVTYEELKFIYSYAKKAIIEVAEIKNRLYDLTYDKNLNGFNLRVRDFFFDYKGEPSVNVEVRMAENPDYDIIANSKFGITFGGENRLFLAGNKTYPHIDRYNVSNDLLGDNVKNQSYELSYFPSKNYRVMGGKGAINGYVIATDEMMYVTKEEYAGDTKLFVRQRILDDDGLVRYNDAKTSIKETPLNHKSIVRFNNDIVMLTKSGLYGIELTSGLITNERMLKPRDGYINKDLKAQIKKARNAFIVEDNHQMLIVLDNVFYVADSRYLSENTHGVVDNTSYEIVKWTFPHDRFIFGGLDAEQRMFFIDNIYSIYSLDENKNADEVVSIYRNGIALVGLNRFMFGGEEYDFIYENASQYKLVFNAKRIVGYEGVHYEHEGDGVFKILNDYVFRNLKDGDLIYGYKYDEEEEKYVIYNSYLISGLEDNNREKFIILEDFDESIALVVSSSEYYIYDYDPVNHDFGLSTFIDSDTTEELNEYIDGMGMFTFKLVKQQKIEMLWISNVDNFDSPLMEKTLYQLTMSINRQALDNTVQFGYRTMRRLNTMQERAKIDVSGGINFDSLDFRTFTFTTFGNQGISMPMKENNFLNIQFIIKATGQVELDAFYLIYKNNRMLKSIG